MNAKRSLIEQIIASQEELNALLKSEGFHSKAVFKLSLRLDRLIVRYYHSKKKHVPENNLPTVARAKNSAMNSTNEPIQ